MDKCIVKGCLNHEGEGRFVSGLCAPCYTMLAQGKKTPSEAWFAKPWVGLTDEECEKIQCDYGRTVSKYVFLAIESKLKDKNT